MASWRQGLPVVNGWYIEERDPSHRHPCEVYEGTLYCIGSETLHPGRYPAWATPERLAVTWFYGPLPDAPPRPRCLLD